MSTTGEQVEAVYRMIRETLAHDQQVPFPDFRKILEKVLADRRPSAGTLPWLLLPIFVCEALNGNVRRAQQVAAALEMGRIAAGLLDEWQDGDTDDALWRTLGAERTVNLGHALVSLSYQAIERLADLGAGPSLLNHLYEEFHQTSFHMSAGQDADLAGNLDLDEYERVAGAKSGSLFRLGCRAGAMIAGAAHDVVDCYSEFGYNLGVVAQMWNDLEGVTGVRGKADAEQQRSLPVLVTTAVEDGHEAGSLYTLVRLQVYHRRAAEALGRCPAAGRLPLFLDVYSTDALVARAQEVLNGAE